MTINAKNNKSGIIIKQTNKAIPIKSPLLRPGLAPRFPFIFFVSEAVQEPKKKPGIIKKRKRAPIIMDEMKIDPIPQTIVLMSKEDESSWAAL